MIENSETHLMEGMLNSIENLPTLPGIAMRILEAVKKEETGVKEISDILSTDPPLTAKILQIANSPFYGFPMQITSVLHAVSLLGMNTVKNLALSFSLIRNNQKGNNDYFNYTSYWKDSLIGAVAAKQIAQAIIPPLSEEAFFLGLLHNIGILAANQCMPKQYSLVLKEKTISACSYHEVENQILGFNHMLLGEALVKSWGLPDIFYMPIGGHHNPDMLKTDRSEIVDLARILHLSSMFVDFFNLPDKSVYLGLLENYAQAYNFSDRIQIETMANEIIQGARHIFPLFELQIEDEEDYTQIIETARNELINLSTAFIENLTSQKKQIEQLKEQVTRDGMTNLYNYQAFKDLLEKELLRTNRYDVDTSLIIADLDHFKKVNDNYGHLAGDHVLRVVAECLKITLRQTDIIARYGGEEFAIILTETSSEKATLTAKRLNEEIKALAIDFEGQKISISISIGIATPMPGENISEFDLIKRADIALYMAKNSGRDRFCVFEAPNKEEKLEAVAG